MLTLADLCEGLTGRRPQDSERIPVANVVVDSRECVPGSAFVALAGEHRDGHEFIGDALARGAVAIVAEARARGQGLGGNLTLIDVAGLQPNPSLAPGPVVFITESCLVALQKLAKYWREKFPKVLTIGVTGSVGKSSTKELIYTVVRRKFVTLKTEGNLNNEIGVPLSLLKLNDKYSRAVLEMGMYALGEIRALCEIAQPHIGVVTNVAPVHLSRLGTIENIAKAKSELVQALPKDGHAILNGDDERVLSMRELCLAPVTLYGLDPSNDVWADEIEGYGLEGIEFTLHNAGGRIRVRVPLLGQHSVHNALAATTVGLVEGLSWEEIVGGLQDVSAQLRLLAVPGKHGMTILDDSYNASPHSMLAAFNLLKDLNGRKIVVLGDMLELGEYEQDAHRLVGLRAAEIADVVVAVGPLGRLIGAAAKETGHKYTYFVDDNNAAVSLLDSLAESGDFVLIKGSRGAHMEEIVSALAAQESEGDGS